MPDSSRPLQPSPSPPPRPLRPPQPSLSPSRPRPQPQPLSSRSAATCQSCGRALHPGERFCARCGQPICTRRAAAGNAAAAPAARTTTRLVCVALGFVLLLSGYYALLRLLGVPLMHYLPEFRGWPLWSAFLLISLMPAVVEEIGFRGIIQSELARIVGGREAWLIQAALFSVLHLLPLMFPSHFLMGLCFGYLRRRSRSLYPGMALHAAWNALVLGQELLG